MSNLMNVIIIILQGLAGLFVLISVLKVSALKNKNNVFISFVLISVLMFFSNYFIPNHLRSIFSILLFTLISFFIFKRNLNESFTSSVLSMIFVALVEIIFSLILFIIGINDKMIVQDSFWKFIFNLLISIFIILLINIKPINRFINKIKNLISKQKYVFNYLIIAIIFIYIITAKNILFSNVTLDLIINLVIILIVFALFIFIFISDNKNRQLEEANKQMLNHVTKYEKIITDQGKANHEFKNQLMVIRGYAQMNSSKLIEYLDSIIEDSKKTHSSYLISQLNKFPVGGIKGLLYYKLSTMDEENIKYELNVEAGVKIRLDTLGTETYKNITKMLGVLFDNAIDACKECKNKKIIIDVVKKTNLVTFSIYNAYKGKIDIDQIGTGYTTKGSGHGYGLRLVKDIIDSSNIFELKNTLEDEYYVTKLTIRTKRKQRKKKK